MSASPNGTYTEVVKRKRGRPSKDSLAVIVEQNAPKPTLMTISVKVTAKEFAALAKRADKDERSLRGYVHRILTLQLEDSEY